MSNDITNRQLEIIAASGKILMEKGILGLTTKNLAQEMSFSESALYRHFKNKEEIILLLIRYLVNNINTRFEEIVNSNLESDEILLALFKSQFSFFKANPHFIIIVLSDGLIDNTEEVNFEIQNLMKSNANHFERVILLGQKSNQITQEIEAEYLIHFIMGTFRLQMLKWKLSNFSFDIEKQGMDTMSNLLQLIKSK